MRTMSKAIMYWLLFTSCLCLVFRLIISIGIVVAICAVIIRSSMAEKDEQQSQNHAEQNNDAQLKDGRLKVKFKLPKTSDGDEVNAPQEEVKSHRCVECNKSFSSGKALGGHMSSAHVQANKDYGLKKLQKQDRSGGSSSSSMGDLIICKLCGKDFPSRKSLFGHMRCHPEREWRGMEPPSSLQAAEPGFGGIGLKQELDDEDQVDSSPSMESVGSGLHESLTGWRGKAKRGRPPSKQDEPAAFVTLKRILRLLVDESGSGQQEKKDEQVEDSSGYSKTHPGPESCDVDKDYKLRKHDSPVKKLKICEPDDESGDRELVLRMKADDGANVDRTGKGKGPLLQSKKSLVMYSSSSEDSDSDDSRVEPSVSLELGESSGDAQKIALMGGDLSEDTEVIVELPTETEENELEARTNQVEPRAEPPNFQNTGAQESHLGAATSSRAEVIPGVEHVCNVCNKTFSTYQALGGHRASHNKLKVCIINRNSVPTRMPRGSTVANKSPALTVVTVQQQQPAAAQDVDSSLHSCVTCNQGFSSGRALEDHMRSHLDQPSSSSSPSKTSPPSEEAKEESNVFGFDLNVMPDEEHGDENGTSGRKS